MRKPEMASCGEDELNPTGIEVNGDRCCWIQRRRRVTGLLASNDDVHRRSHQHSVVVWLWQQRELRATSTMSGLKGGMGRQHGGRAEKRTTADYGGLSVETGTKRPTPLCAAAKRQAAVVEVTPRGAPSTARQRMPAGMVAAGLFRYVPQR